MSAGGNVHKYSLVDHNWLVIKMNNRQVAKRLSGLCGTVYDFGCGTRPYEQDINQFASQYIGVDWSNSYHELRADIVANLNKRLPIGNAVAEAVVSFQVLEHLSEPQIMLDEAFRILKRGGSIFLAVPFQWHVHEAPWDFFRFTQYGLKHLLGKAGFLDIEVESVGGFWMMWLLKFNYQTLRLVRGPKVVRSIVRGILVPFWFVNQSVALLLDNLWYSEGDSAGYFVTARKP